MLRAPGTMSVGPMLLQWFLLNLVVAFVAACMAVGAMSAHQAAHTAGLATLLAYGAGAVSEGDLDGQAPGGHAQGPARCADLRRGHRRGVHVALA